MNSSDAIRWINYHSAVFPDFGDWYTNLDSEAREILTATWQGRLSKVDLDATKAATDEMVSGGIKKPFPASDTLAVIIPEARKQKTFQLKSIPTVTREESFRCLICRDTGYAVCWAPLSMRSVKDGTFGKPFTLYSTSVYCSCELGIHISDNSAKKPGDRKWTVYDARVWLILDRTEDGKHIVGQPSDPAEQDRLREFMENIGERCIASKEWGADADVDFASAEEDFK